jgi:nucleoside-diphosphate-sugar epimerase
MNVFLTGATGFIGSALIPQLVSAGHSVLGLARSDDGARAIEKLGARVHRGSLEDMASLRAGASRADAVIHCGFIHEFTKFKENCEIDGRAIAALGDELAGSHRKLIVTAGTGFPAPGGVRTEDDPPNPVSAHMPRVSEQTAEAQLARGVHAMAVRLPQVHDPLRQGLTTYQILLAKEKGVSAYIGDGSNRWPACHRDAAAEVFKLALEKGEPGARYHAVAEQGVSFRAIAESIGRALKLPVVSIAPGDAAAHFGWMAGFASVDMPASSVLTQQRLGWTPRGPTMIEDLDRGEYA